jgi:hypothetical protein
VGLTHPKDLRLHNIQNMLKVWETLEKLEKYRLSQCHQITNNKFNNLKLNILLLKRKNNNKELVILEKAAIETLKINFIQKLKLQLIILKKTVGLFMIIEFLMLPNSRMNILEDHNIFLTMQVRILLMNLI